jgi:hypothetical protein
MSLSSSIEKNKLQSSGANARIIKVVEPRFKVLIYLTTSPHATS